MAKKFYITNSIPYINAPPHIGHALEFVQSDVIARYHKMIGDETLLLCGSDENALKNVQAAEKAGTSVQKFVDQNAKEFQRLAKELNVEFDVFQKGSDQKNHYPASQKLWELCKKSGDIYKKEYKGLYCVGCEIFYTVDELDKNGECFQHPGKKLDEVSETNYFFKLSRYQSKLIEIISNDRLKIIPASRKNEMLSFLRQPLRDVSISRTNERARNWGVPVPGDETQRIYVWFDALNIYQSGIGFNWDQKKYNKWWPTDVHVIGKDIVRFHSIYWIAFLLSAGLDLPKSIFVHGFLTVEGQKMSKTVGNVIDPFELIRKYGTDPLRYYFLREIPSYDDGDYSEHRMQEIYKSDLSNELGNLVLRITTIAEKDSLSVESKVSFFCSDAQRALERFEFNKALGIIWEEVKKLNKEIDEFAPWKKRKKERKSFIIDSIKRMKSIGFMICPFLPKTGERIMNILSGSIKKGGPLFPRL